MRWRDCETPNMYLGRHLRLGESAVSHKHYVPKRVSVRRVPQDLSFLWRGGILRALGTMVEVIYLILRSLSGGSGWGPSELVPGLGISAGGDCGLTFLIFAVGLSGGSG